MEFLLPFIFLPFFLKNLKKILFSYIKPKLCIINIFIFKCTLARIKKKCKHIYKKYTKYILAALLRLLRFGLWSFCHFASKNNKKIRAGLECLGHKNLLGRSFSLRDESMSDFCDLTVIRLRLVSNTVSTGCFAAGTGPTGRLSSESLAATRRTSFTIFGALVFDLSTCH